ncbi:hypothetical protein MAPG_11540 [Magnaporthiopsis poae ATCC 64411]|uniref:Uncharacterized protein n=1 Tax=Magnaporthiopsis poae (strain ATCC 64411 / 73-15) TaxID=644358 RepID=A0A0C4EFJ0_MAGP6|nr:hypothetical protein MAPG_11540 [Magnaporthiopsis poae ATCC 64411]
MASELPSDDFSATLSGMGDAARRAILKRVLGTPQAVEHLSNVEGEGLRPFAAALEGDRSSRVMAPTARRGVLERDLAGTARAAEQLSIGVASSGGTDAAASVEGDLRELLDNMDDEELRQFVAALEDDPGSQVMASAARRAVFERELETRIQWTEDVWFACLLGMMEASGQIWSFLVDPHIAGSMPFIMAFNRDLVDLGECHKLYSVLLQREGCLVTAISCPEQQDQQEGSVQQFLGNWFDEIVTLTNGLDTGMFTHRCIDEDT